MMLTLSRLVRTRFQDVVAPSILQGLSPSWSGIFKRIISPARIVHHPKLGTYTVIRLSRDEYQRLADHNYRKELSKGPGFSIDVVIEDDTGADDPELIKRAEAISAWAKTQIK